MNEIQQTHESLLRLIEAASKKFPDEIGPSAIARRIGELPNTITNWKTRGVSDRGAIAAEEAYGVSAVWILKGIDPIKNPWPFKRIDERKVLELSYEDLIAVETAILLEVRRTFDVDIQRSAAKVA